MQGNRSLKGFVVATVTVALSVGAAAAARNAFAPAGAKVSPSDETSQPSTGYTGSKFGASVALSRDGHTAVVGGFTDSGGGGAAWIYNRDSGGWSQGPKLMGAGEIGPGWFGTSVALSADGSTALVGAPQDNINVGGAWVFTRSGSAWAQQGAKLVGSAPSSTVQDGFGFDVALSGDGNLALVGAYTYRNNRGAAFAYARTGETWTRFGKILTGAGEKVSGYYGSSVALSGDGTTATIGAPGDDEGIGGVWTYARTGAGWKQIGTKLVPRGASGHSAFGCSVALSDNGRALLVGGCHDRKNVGAVWAYTRAGGTWKQLGSKLVGSGERGQAEFGWTTSLAPDGGTAVIGAPDDSGTRGAAFLFARSGSRWHQTGKLVGAGGVGGSAFGFAVALSGDTTTIVAGGPNDHASVGAVWPFASTQRRR